MNPHYPFRLPPLPYGVEALEPYMDAETVMLHHGKHLQAYIDHLNHALQPHPQYHFWGLNRLICDNRLLPPSIRRAVWDNAGGVLNHQLFFETMQPPKGQQPLPHTAQAIRDSFGSYDAFRAEFKKAALDVFGSGWAWLAVDPRGKLVITTTANQDTLLPLGLEPLLPVDVWEHAYYLKYQNRREEYLDGWFHLINWAEVEWRYLKWLEHRPQSCPRPRCP